MGEDKNTSSASFYKSMLKSVGLFGIAIVVQRVASFLLLPFNTRYLSTADYGMLDLIEQISTPLSILLGMSFASALGYFYNQKSTEIWRETVTGTILTGTALIGVVAACVGWFLVPLISQGILGNQELTPYLLAAVVSFPVGGAFEAMMSWLRIRDNASFYVMVSILRLILVLTCTVVGLSVFGLRVWAVLGSNLLGFVLCTALLVFYYFRKAPLRVDRNLIGPMFRYSFPMGISYMAMFVLLFGDRLILPHYVSLGELGIYSVSCKVGMLLSFVHSSFGSYYNAQVFQIVKRDDARQIFSRLFVYVAAATCFAALGLIATAGLAIRWFTAPAYHGAAALVPVVVLAFVFRIFGDYFRNLFFATDHTRQEAIANWTASFVCLGAYMALIPRYGTAGAAWATLLAFLFSAVLLAVWSHRYWTFQLETSRLIRLGVIFSLLVVLSFVSWDADWKVATWAVFLLILYPSLLWASGFFTEGEIQRALALKQNLLARYS